MSKEIIIFQVFQNCYIDYEHIPISSTTMIFYLGTLSLSNTKLHTMNCLFACLFWFSSHLRIFHSYGEVIITSEGVQILIYARYSWPLTSEGFLVCHTHCDTEHLFILVIFEDPWQSHLLSSVWQRNCHYLFLRLRSVASGIRTPSVLHARRTL